LAVSSDLRAEEAPEEEPQSSQAGAQLSASEPEVPDCETKPPWWTEEARIIRQNPDSSKHWCDEETSSLNQDPPEESVADISPDPRPGGLNKSAMALSSAAITLGAGGGLVSGYVAAVTVCELGGHGGGVWGLDCFVGTPAVLGASVLTAIVGGTLGYKNSRLALTLGGAFMGFGVGGILTIESALGTDEWVFVVGALLTGAGGAALGNHIWKALDARSRRVAVSPFWDEETSGVMLSGRF